MERANLERAASARRDLLIRMLQAERAQQRRGQRDTFVLYRAATGPEILTAGWDPSWAVLGEQDIDDLVEDGLLRLVDDPAGRGRKFDFARAGRVRAQQLERERTVGGTSDPIDLSWPATLVEVVAEGERALFVGRTGHRLTARAIDLVVRKVAGRAGLGLSAHVLRHTCITKLVRAGNDIVLVAVSRNLSSLRSNVRNSA